MGGIERAAMQLADLGRLGVELLGEVLHVVAAAGEMGPEIVEAA